MRAPAPRPHPLPVFNPTPKNRHPPAPIHRPPHQAHQHHAMAWNNNKTGHVDTATKRRIMARDNGICCECGQPGANQIDHRHPLSQGGTHNDTNLAAIHADPCHRNKTEQERLAGIQRKTGRKPPPPHPGLA